MLHSGDDNSSDSAEKGYNTEFRSYPDDSWHIVRVLLEGDSGGKLRVKYDNLPDDHDNVFLAESFKSKDELYDFIRRFRKVSTQLQDPDCSKVVKGTCVCASDSFGKDKIRFYDAVVEDVLHKKHSNVNGEEECKCTFMLFWLHGPNVGNVTYKGVADICLLQGSGLQTELASFMEIALQKIEKALCKSVSGPTNDLACNLVAQLRESNGSSIVKKKRSFAGTLRQMTDTHDSSRPSVLSRRRSTGSERQRCTGVVDTVAAEERQQANTSADVAGEEMQQASTASDVVAVEQRQQANTTITGPFPGGPADPSILTSFRTHVAAAIWEGKDRGLIKVTNHAQKIDTWSLDSTRSRIRHIVQQSGLAALVDCSYGTCNRTIITAFTERWQPETSTFHMPFGEMTITLDDVSTLLGIPIMGDTVAWPSISINEANEMLVRLLGVDVVKAIEETNVNKGPQVRLTWLKDTFATVTDSDDDQIEYAARAYLLFLLGCTLLADKTCTKVPIAYLTLLEDLSVVGHYAWGAACLANLYRNLGEASRSECQSIAGYMTLIQAWIYEHFPSLEPVPNMSFKQGMPLARRWKQRSYTMDLQILRERLDDIQCHQVNWDPYIDIRDYYPLPLIAFFSGMIKCGAVVEPYHPDRVLRQWGYLQTIPRSVFAPAYAERGSKPATYNVQYYYIENLWVQWDLHVLNEEKRGIRCRTVGECSQEYMSWYDTISHRFVQNPTHRSIPQQRSLGHDRILRDIWSRVQPMIAAGDDQGIDVWRGFAHYVHNVISTLSWAQETASRPSASRATAVSPPSAPRAAAAPPPSPPRAVGHPHRLAPSF